MRVLAAICLLALCLAACGGADEAVDPDAGGGATDRGFDADRAFADLEAQVELGPRPAGSAAAKRTARLIADGFESAGREDVRIQRPVANVIATIPGEEPGAVIVGAHYDTKDGIPGFVGANDGASGVAVLLELARALPQRMPGPRLQLVAFDGEESRGDRPFHVDGKRGSRQYVADAERGGRQGAIPLEEIRAMVLFDLVGDCDLEIPREAASDEALYRLFSDAAQVRTGDAVPFVGEAPPVDDDHVSFLEAGIPAVDLIDFEYGPGPSPGRWWHTPEDTMDKVCPESLDAVGEAALVALPRIR